MQAARPEPMTKMLIAGMIGNVMESDWTEHAEEYELLMGEIRDWEEDYDPE